MGKDVTALLGPRPRRSRRVAIGVAIGFGIVEFLVDSAVDQLGHRSTGLDVALVGLGIAGLFAALMYARWPRPRGRHQR